MRPRVNTRGKTVIRTAIWLAAAASMRPRVNTRGKQVTPDGIPVYSPASMRPRVNTRGKDFIKVVFSGEAASLQ